MKKESLGQFLKFALVGVLNTVVDFLVFQLLNLTLGLDVSCAGNRI